ncbi:MAG: hypothetical protein AAGG55_13005 [Pseudomonadota bacterium]
MALLDCRDTRITLWQGGSALPSPGFVLLEGSEYRFGQMALEQSRLRPRDSNSRYWWQLSTQPLKPTLGAARHTADLVHAHLRHVHQEGGKPDALTLVVPDSMPREQLSLLLGIAQACEFDVMGLVSRSVLLATAKPAPGHGERVLHVEAQLNQTIVNDLVRDGDDLRLERSTPLPACGLLALQERCVSAISSAFVQQTRFDPRRAAASEQTLYNRLPQILQTLRDKGECSIDIDGHRCRVTNTTMAGVSDRLLTGLSQARGDLSATMLLDDELQLLPGMNSLEGQVVALDGSDLWAAWTHHSAAVEAGSDEIHLIDRLPVVSAASAPGDADATAAVAESANAASEPKFSDDAAAPEGSSSVTPPASNPAPTAALTPAPNGATTPGQATHVLIGAKAMPLRGNEVSLDGGFALRNTGGYWTLHGDGSLINGLPGNAHQPLQLGDTLSLGHAGHGRLIEVMD